MRIGDTVRYTGTDDFLRGKTGVYKGTSPRHSGVHIVEFNGQMWSLLPGTFMVLSPAPQTLAEAVGVKPEQKDTNPKDAVASSKLPLWLLSPIAKAHWAVAQAVGMVKYGAWNWRVTGVRSSIYLSAIQRHFDRYISGEDYDPVDGQHNLGAIMACCAILLDAKAAGKLNDDRPPSVAVQETYTAMERVFADAIKRAQAAGLNPEHHTIKDTDGIR